jgi:voltage-gated potassium channel
MTVITVSTVGLTEVHALDAAGRLHTIVLIIFGVGTVATTLSVLFEQLFRRQVKIIMEKRGMHRTISTLNAHTIVCGFGRMGRMIASSLKDAGKSVVVIEKIVPTADKIEQSGFLVVRGNASDEETLRKAGIDKATSLVATLGTDADNLFLTLTARGLNDSLNIIVRAEDENNTRKFTQAGASRVVSPFAIGAGHIVRVLTRPTVVDFVDLLSNDDDIKFEVAQTDIDQNSPFAGKTLAEAHVRQELGGMVLAIRNANGRLLFDPAPNTRIDEGDTLYVIGSLDSDRS